MNLSWQKSLASAALFTLVVTILVLAEPWSMHDHPAPARDVLLSFLPYLLTVAGMALSIIFRHSREFNLLLFLLLLHLSLDHFVWAVPGDDPLVATLLPLFIPAVFLLNELLRERGVLSQYGLLRICLTGLLASLLILLLMVRPEGLVPLLQLRLLPTEFTAFGPLSDLAAVSALGTGLFLLYRCFRYSACLQNSILFAFVATVLASMRLDSWVAANSWLITAEAFLIAGIIFNSWSLAWYDELTGLASRRALRQHLQQLGRRYTIAMVDIDHFKKINDRWGHDTGDQVLRMVAAQLRQIPGGHAYRYGGEEFTIVFPGYDREESQVLMESLRQRLEEHLFQLRARRRPRQRPTNGKRPAARREKPALNVTVSVGLAEKTPRHQAAEDVVTAADRALYRAKRSGRNRVVAI
ncbi:MAG TPA: GGDEF domain-containing protein [Gammaproteobacteria bacterium]|nr:GGDEF domain-containing protein [Gammaproteobacteria bacterium]